MRFTPGCNCCTCVADSNHVCLCSCLTPFPKTYFVEDSLGSHAITYIGSQTWRGAVTGPSMSQMVRFQSGINICCPTPFYSGNYLYAYILTLTCPSTWKLTIIAPTNQCSTIPQGINCDSSGLTSYYGNATTNSSDDVYIFGGGWGTSINNSITAGCNPSSLTFTLPTTIPFTSPSLAMIGGGGTITVTP